MQKFYFAAIGATAGDPLSEFCNDLEKAPDEVHILQLDGTCSLSRPNHDFQSHLARQAKCTEIAVFVCKSVGK